jgi:NADH:ubiquinone oxidoreductase subunit 2 (subunit N)
LVRNILVHCLPLVASLITTFMADVVYMESDWFNNLEIGVLYVFTNYCVTMYAGSDEIYYLNWATETTSLATYKPLIDSFCLGLIASAMHIMICLMT